MKTLRLLLPLLLLIPACAEKVNPDGTPMVLQTNNTDIKISRVMDKKEAADVVAALKKLS